MKHSPRVALALLVTLALTLCAASLSAAPASQPQVRMIYLVPADRTPRDDYRQAIEKAALDLQYWFSKELGGITFALHAPVVEVYQTNHNADWYSTNPNAGGQPSFWENTLADGFALTRGGFDDPENRWIYYIDADPACGQGIGATHGVALLAANDLRGLTGQAFVPICPGDSDANPLCRWVGGLGHELGHSFNLPHPTACEDNDPNTPCPGSTLMYFGYAIYPNTYLLPEDKDALRAQTTFFKPRSLNPGSLMCSVIDATATSTRTATNTRTATSTRTATPTSTATSSPTGTATSSPTGTATSSPTGTLAAATTFIPSATDTATPTTTNSATPTATSSATRVPAPGQSSVLLPLVYR